MDRGILAFFFYFAVKQNFANKKIPTFSFIYWGESLTSSCLNDNKELNEFSFSLDQILDKFAIILSKLC